MKKILFSVFFFSMVISGGFSQVIYANDTNIEDIVGEGTAFVYFYAEWCQFSALFTPIYKQIASEWEDYTFIMVDSDESPITYNAFGSSIPGVVFFEEGMYSDSFSSHFSRTHFEKWCRNNLGLESYSNSHTLSEEDLEFIVAQSTEWEVYFPSSRESYNVILLEMNENRIVYMYTIDFGTEEDPSLYSYLHVWDRYGESYWSYSFDIHDRGRAVLEDSQPGLYKFNSRKLDKHNEDYWSITYLIDKGTDIDKSQLKAY